jgi:hypothetical protein
MPSVANTPASKASRPSTAVSADTLLDDGWPVGRVVLVVVGAILLALFIEGFVAGQKTGSGTGTTTQAVTSTVKTTTSASMTTTVTTQPKAVTSTSVSGPPSEGLLLALLGFGSASLLAGGMYTRISTIKLPGGVELDLTPEERAAVTAQLTSHVTGADPATAITAMEAALELARSKKIVSGKPLTESAIEDAVTKGIAIAAKPALG